MKWIFLRANVAALIICSAFSPAEAQRTRASETLYFRFTGGYSIDETDFPSYAVEPFAMTGEVGYQFTHSWGLGLNYMYGEYPRLPSNYGRGGAIEGDWGTVRHTLSAMARFTPLPVRRFTPVLTGGANITFGGPKVAFGPSAGITGDLAVTRRVQLFAEAVSHWTFPDDAVDGVVGGRGRWDALGTFAVGFRATIRPASIRAEVQPQGPARADRAEVVRFTAVVNDDATRPIRYTWQFGDGQTAVGETVEHRYRLEGDYEVTVRADNRWGASAGSMPIRIDEPDAPARIVRFEADPMRVEVGDRVSFGSNMTGASTVNYSLDFGDGSEASSGASEHGYDEQGSRIGALALLYNDSHTYLEAGTYTATLEAHNHSGRDQRSLTIEVTGTLCPECPEPDPVCDEFHPVFFHFDRHDLTPEARQLLDDNADRLRQCPNVAIRVDGYTDHAGPDGYNVGLSERRAASVQQYYIQHGVSTDRITTRALGKAPVRCSPEEVRVGCRSNRRAETIPLGGPMP